MKPIQDVLQGITDPELKNTLVRLEKSMSEREDSHKIKSVEPKQKAKVIQLPLWSEPKRGVPNSALRGALFAAIQGKGRHYMKRELLFAQQGIEIRFTGMQLDQSDLDVWEQALHLARQHPLGTRCHFTAHSFLQQLGRRTGKSDHEWLKDVFARLAGAVAEITHNSMTYFGPMIEGGVRDEETGQYVLEINPKIMALYAAGWTATDWQQRQALRRKPLALWLHGFYGSHAHPHPLSVEYLHKLSGSRDQNIRGFKRNLKKAHEALISVGAIRDFDIEGNLVSVDSVPSRSQKRYLTKSPPRRKK